MANGYDAHSLARSGIVEAASSSAMPMSKMMPVAVRDRRFTRTGIGYRTQREATSLNPGGVGQFPPPIMYPGGIANQKRGMDKSKLPWETAQEATSPQIRPRDTLERSGLMEALPPWLQKKGEGDDEEQKEAARRFVQENLGGFPCEEDARIALAVLSQFVSGDTLDGLQQAIEDQYGDPMDEPPAPEGDWGDDWDEPSGYMDESALQEAPLTADKRSDLDNSDFALPGRKYPIDTPARARAALARVKQFGKTGEEAKVKAAVKKKYPNMDVS
jgi:hypothetical protein